MADIIAAIAQELRARSIGLHQDYAEAFTKAFELSEVLARPELNFSEARKQYIQLGQLSMILDRKRVELEQLIYKIAPDPREYPDFFKAFQSCELLLGQCYHCWNGLYSRATDLYKFALFSNQSAGNGEPQR